MGHEVKVTRTSPAPSLRQASLAMAGPCERKWINILRSAGRLGTPGLPSLGACAYPRAAAAFEVSRDPITHPGVSRALTLGSAGSGHPD